jgi:hypothetical protein
VIRTWAVDKDGNMKNARAINTGEKSREGIRRKNIETHLVRAIAIATPLTAKISVSLEGRMFL